MHKNKNYDLIIFDCDGTLADSEIAHNTVMMEQMHSLGLTDYTLDTTMDAFMGHSITGIAKILDEKHSIAFEKDSHIVRQKRFAELLPDHIRMDGTTRPFVEKLHLDGQKIAVGSNGDRNNVIRTLEAAGLKEFFPDEFIFTFEDVKHPKPAPDLYLHVCDAMQVKPENAIVIEDTIAGAMAGVAANIDTVGYTGLTHREDQAQRLSDIGCKFIIQSMDKLSDILNKNQSDKEVA